IFRFFMMKSPGKSLCKKEGSDPRRLPVSAAIESTQAATASDSARRRRTVARPASAEPSNQMAAGTGTCGTEVVEPKLRLPWLSIVTCDDACHTRAALEPRLLEFAMRYRLVELVPLVGNTFSLLSAASHHVW